MMAERSATDMALADAFAEAGVDIKSSLGVCKQDLTAAVGDLLQRAQDAGAVRTDVSVSDVFALLMSTCLACGRQGREDASRAPGRRGARRPPAALAEAVSGRVIAGHRLQAGPERRGWRRSRRPPPSRP